ARPVRTVANSEATCSTACSIFISASVSKSSIIGASLRTSRTTPLEPSSSSADDGPDRLLAQHSPDDGPRFGHVEHDDRDVVFLAHRNGSGVHHPEIPGEELQIG